MTLDSLIIVMCVILAVGGGIGMWISNNAWRYTYQFRRMRRYFMR